MSRRSQETGEVKARRVEERSSATRRATRRVDQIIHLSPYGSFQIIATPLHLSFLRMINVILTYTVKSRQNSHQVENTQQYSIIRVGNNA